MKMRRSTIFASTVFAISTAALAFEVSSESTAGRTVRFTSEQPTLNQETQEGTVCVSDAVPVKKVKLWMPEHGHGSSATKLSPLDANCSKVSDLNFTMPGSWQLKIDLADGDKAILTVDIK